MSARRLEDRARGDGRASVVAFVGFSGTGKTTLLERLIPMLRARGMTVGAVKHTSHGFSADQPGKDSHRIYSAGASAVTLVSGHQLVTFRRRAGDAARLSEALAEMPAGLDLVLVEGFAWEPVPRVVLVRQGATPPPDLLEPGPVLMTIELPEPAGCEPPEVDEEVMQALVELLLERALHERPTRARTRAGAQLARLTIASALPEGGR